MSEHYVPNLDEALIKEACRHTHAFWGRDRTLDEHIERAFQRIHVAGPDQLRRVGCVNDRGELLCSLARYSVLLAVPSTAGPRTARAVGIGSVFTPEPYRGRGLATRMLREVMDEARALGDEAALLYSDIDPAFYARLGYVEYPALDLSAPTEALPEDGPLATRPAGPEDTPRLQEWFASSYPATFLRPARDAALWRFFRWMNAGELPDLILSDGTRDVGYLHAGPAGNVLEVEEWAAPSVAPSRLWATLRVLATAAGAERISGWLRPDQVDARFTITRRPQAIPMIADLIGTLHLAAIPPERTHFSSIDHF